MQLRVAGQAHRVVTTASDGDLKRFVAIIEDRLGEISGRGKAPHPQALLLAALALAHDLEEERERSRRIEARARETLSQLLTRIDAALDDGADDVAVERPPPPAP